MGKPLSSFPTLTCHCTSCKRRSGGVASYAFVVPKQHAQFTPAFDGNQAGVHKVFEDRDTGSGKPMQRTMCAECGSPVCIVEASDPDARCLQYGLFAAWTCRRISRGWRCVRSGGSGGFQRSEMR